jgi:hypothetical protein
MTAMSRALRAAIAEFIDSGFPGEIVETTSGAEVRTSSSEGDPRSRTTPMVWASMSPIALSNELLKVAIPQ